MNVFKQSFFCLFLIFGLIFALSAQSAQNLSGEFYPSEKLKYGDVLFAKTRIENNEMHTFPVRVISLQKAFSFTESPHILATTDDPYINSIGGIANGMSGSPVYFGDKLVGAIAYSWNFLRKPMMQITPIAEMLNIMDYQGLEPADNSYSINPKDREDQEGDWQDASLPRLRQRAGSDFIQYLIQYLKEENDRLKAEGRDIPSLERTIDYLTASPVNKTSPPNRLQGDRTFPITLSISRPGGLSKGIEGVKLGELNRTWNFFQSRVFPGIKVLPAMTPASSGIGSDSDEDFVNTPPIPGDLIGINYIRGDIEMSVYGTVTYVKGDTILAFGHKMNREGAVSLPLYKAHNDAVISSILSPSKIGSLVREIGTLEQDRTHGILGKLGTKASYIPVQVKLTSPLRKETYRFDVANIKNGSDIFIGFALFILYSSEENTGHPASINYSIRADYPLPDDPDHFTVMSNRIDASRGTEGVGGLVWEIVRLLNLVRDNDWEAAPVKKLTISIESKPVYNFLKAVMVMQNKTVYRPGEVIHFKVGFDRYRQPRLYKEFTYKIPPETPDGDNILMISSSLDRWLLENALTERESSLKTLKEVEKFTKSRPPNNSISLWEFERKGSLWVKDRIYRHLPANSSRLLQNSFHSEKAEVLQIRSQDYDMGQQVSGAVPLNYRVKMNQKD